MKCGNCGQDILQAHPEMCPYCRSRNLISEGDTEKKVAEAGQLAKAGRFEEAALILEQVDHWKEAKECRLRAKKKPRAELPSGKLGTVTLLCPHCGHSQEANLKVGEQLCTRCGTRYVVPPELLGLQISNPPSKKA